MKLKIETQLDEELKRNEEGINSPVKLKRNEEGINSPVKTKPEMLGSADKKCIASASPFREFDPYLFIRMLPPLTHQQLLRPCVLPKKTRSSPRVTLVLDLDETLVHCSTASLIPHDVQFPVSFNGSVYTVSGRFRPHYLGFLQAVAEKFEVVVFTASQKVYADELLNIIDPTKSLIKYRLFRDSCLYVDGNFLKHLDILGRDLAHTVIVDNSPQAFGYQVSNGIPISSWYEDQNDSELLNVLSFLKTIETVDDVRYQDLI
jgi:CTD small phosphatase-like protein 2